jgi:hypothetical protein
MKKWPPKECEKLSESYKNCFGKIQWTWAKRGREFEKERERCEDIFEELQECIQDALEKAKKKK